MIHGGEWTCLVFTNTIVSTKPTFANMSGDEHRQTTFADVGDGDEFYKIMDEHSWNGKGKNVNSEKCLKARNGKESSSMAIQV